MVPFANQWKRTLFEYFLCCVIVIIFCCCVYAFWFLCIMIEIIKNRIQTKVSNLGVAALGSDSTSRILTLIQT